MLYQLVAWLLFIGIFPFFSLYALLTGKHRAELGQRLGFVKPIEQKKDNTLRIWLHAASVGEIQVARALISELKIQMPQAALFVSTVTPQGYAVAKEQLPRDVTCFVAPLDLAGIVHRVTGAVRPDVYICLETELWPAMLGALYRSGTKLFLLNGRLSEGSLKGYKKIKSFLKVVLGRFNKIAVISPADAQRYIDLGAEAGKINVLGNAKYDQALAQADEHEKKRCRQLLDIAPGQPVFIAGSTHSGEEDLLITVFEGLKKKLPDLIWIVAPRHLQRIGEVEASLGEKGVAFDHLSSCKAKGRNSQVVLVDSMGELAKLYSVATYIFCGGSLVERGGHNVLEAAIWGRPVFYGPSMKDFADAQDFLEEANAGFLVKNQAELLEKVIHYIDAPAEYEAAGERARQVAISQQGSAKKQIALIKDAATI